MQDAQSLIEVKRAILHILDLNSGVPVFSDEDLDREIFEFLQKHLEKAWKDPAAHNSAIGQVNPVRVKLAEYEQRGWTARRGRRWHFTPEGFLLSNRLIGELLELQEVETLANTLEKIRGGQLPRKEGMPEAVKK